MKVSVVCTVLNEAGSLAELLESLATQSRAPDEVVVADGGSTDGTLETLQRYVGPLPLRVIECPGANIAQGRNTAIRAAAGEVIAVTDAGVRASPQWLEELVYSFEASDVEAVAGFFVADPSSTFEVALGATVLPLVEDILPERFLPSSRSVAFRKALWERVGGYPEWLDYCEDLVFDLRIKRLGVSFVWRQEALVHFRPRPCLGAFFKQYYLYARGDGKADLWLKRHVIRYAVYLLTVPALLAGAAYPVLWGALGIGVAAYVLRPYQRLSRSWHSMSVRQRLAAITWVPVIRLTGDVAKMLGYPVGRWWRFRRRMEGLKALSWADVDGRPSLDP